MYVREKNQNFITFSVENLLATYRGKNYFVLCVYSTFCSTFKLCMFEHQFIKMKSLPEGKYIRSSNKYKINRRFMKNNALLM